MSIVDTVLIFLFLFWVASILILLNNQRNLNKAQLSGFEKICSLIHEQNMVLMKIVVHLETGRKE